MKTQSIIPLFTATMLMASAVTASAQNATLSKAQYDRIQSAYPNLKSKTAVVNRNSLSYYAELRGTAVSATSGFYSGYCTAHAARNFSGIDFGGDADAWYKNASAKGWEVNRDTDKIEIGSLLIWSYKHVAVVTGVANGTISYTDANGGSSLNDATLANLYLTTDWDTVKSRSTTASNLGKSGSFTGAILHRPAAPSGLMETLTATSVKVDFMDVPGASAYRVQIAPVGTPYTSKDGFTTATTASATVVVNSAWSIPSGSSDYTWKLNSAGSFRAPLKGEKMQWIVRVNVPSKNAASFYSAPRTFTVPLK